MGTLGIEGSGCASGGRPVGSEDGLERLLWKMSSSTKARWDAFEVWKWEM